MSQYKPFIASRLQRFFVHCVSILHLRINILIIYIYINSFPCALLNRHRKRHDRNEKNPFFRIRKSGLLPPELLGLTRQSPLFRTQKSLVSYTEVPCFKAHLDIARSSSPAAPGLPPIQLDNRYQLMPASNPDRKGPSIPATRNA